MFNELMLMAEMKVLPRGGGLYNQDSETVENLSWFLPRYEMAKFSQKVLMVLGDGDGKKDDGNIRRPASKNKR